MRSAEQFLYHHAPLTLDHLRRRILARRKGEEPARRLLTMVCGDAPQRSLFRHVPAHAPRPVRRVDTTRAGSPALS